MSVGVESELRQEIERLRAQLERHEREAQAKERQLQKYAHDLNETFKLERARRLELQRSYMATVVALSNAVEARDVYTSKHAERVAAYAMEIGHAAGLEFSERPEVQFGFLLHDVGKIAVPDAILYKPDSLSPQERLVMQQHPVTGAKIVAGFLPEAATVVRSHHERWDGTGYPDGLSREAIPVEARVFAVADVLDALTTDRPYRPASPIAEARRMIVAEAGSHFDPAVIDAFGTVPDGTFDRIGREIR